MQDDRTLGPFLKNSFGDRYLFEVNGTAFDKVGSANSFKKHYGKVFYEENRLYIFVGSDSALLPKYIIEEGLPVISAWKAPEGKGPFVVKERFGAGSRSLGLNLDRDAALAHARYFTNPIYQPFVAGREVSVDAWFDRQHRVKGLVLRTRDEVVNGESVITTTFRNAKLESECRRALGFAPPVWAGSAPVDH